MPAADNIYELTGVQLTVAAAAGRFALELLEIGALFVVGERLLAQHPFGPILLQVEIPICSGSVCGGVFTTFLI